MAGGRYLTRCPSPRDMKGTHKDVSTAAPDTRSQWRALLAPGSIGAFHSHLEKVQLLERIALTDVWAVPQTFQLKTISNFLLSKHPLSQVRTSTSPKDSSGSLRNKGTAAIPGVRRKVAALRRPVRRSPAGLPSKLH